MLPQHAPLMRSMSVTSTTSKSRPISRGSTTSEHSVGHAVPQFQTVPLHPGTYMAQPNPPQQQNFQNPEEVLLQYGQHIAQNQPYNIDPTLAAGLHHEMRPGSQQGYPTHEMRPATQHGYPNHEVNQFNMMEGYPHGMPQYGMPQQVMNHAHAQTRNLDCSENQSPAPEDSENADPAAKKKKGAATSLANDAELRRLLQQYQGRTLKAVAAEVQRKEGGEGKSEKAKQVFAMLWLQENCQRSSNSVRRDRVFSRYTERCGNERVPTLNPASFGKLVRIIFPNVQTRRLGVRGESKYHYVDLSLFPEDDDRQHLPFHMRMSTVDSTDEMNNAVPIPRGVGVYPSHARSASVPQPIMPQPPSDTADFPLPSKTFGPRTTDQIDTKHTLSQPPQVSGKSAASMDCLHLNTPLIRIRAPNMSIPLVSALPAVRSNLPGSLSSYLGLPSPASHTSSSLLDSQTDSPIDLPDIHSYLTNANYDRDVAESLSHLYRSYCIIVIDSFRFVREKPFFHHHSAFNGTMTVPVSKLLANERLAPWIQECDMRMYKKMTRYISPLVTQVVPDRIWNILDNVSNKLVSHIVSAFEEKCPTHVVVAKVVPAARFCHLLKKLKSANTAANHAGSVLFDEGGRTHMWVDLLACVDPERVVEDSMPPPESWNSVEGMIGHDIKRLIAANDEEYVRDLEHDPSNPFSAFLATVQISDLRGVLEATADARDASMSHLDRWIQWLERIHLAFPRHEPQCVINWHNAFWKSITTQLGTRGASTYQAWWYLEAFLNNMLGYLTQMEGLLMDETQQKEIDRRQVAKGRREEAIDSDLRETSLQIDETNEAGGKRKRDEEDIGGEERSASRASSSSRSSNEGDGGSRPQTAMTSNTGLDGTEDDHDLDELDDGAPLDLPSIDTSSPQKQRHQGHDDSGISLDTEVENGSGADEHLRRLKNEWGILSDPADADGHVVVI